MDEVVTTYTLVIMPSDPFGGGLLMSHEPLFRAN